jgi:4-hydroxy-3-methylbut-2-enyl diphosphate reductase
MIHLNTMKITLSNHLSYCFGVKRTLNLIETILRENPDKNYMMLGEIVHNEYVINDLKKKGLIFINTLENLPCQGTVIIQSHGVGQAIYRFLENNHIDYVDATCPMVKKIHKEIKQLEDNGFQAIIIGKKGHDEVTGIAGQVQKSIIIGNISDPALEEIHFAKKAGVVIQSTFIREDAREIIEEIKKRIEEVQVVDTICKPTTDRQDELNEKSKHADCVIIIGSSSSANTRHLFKIAKANLECVYLIDHPEKINALNLSNTDRIFVTSGASTPMYLIDHAIALLIEKTEA